MLSTMRHSYRSGFTIIELLITMIVITILTTLGVMSVTSLQRDARDRERKEDIASIARGLELRYTRGNPKITSTSPAPLAPSVGTYPGIREFNHALGNLINGDGTYGNPSYTPNQVASGYMTEELPGTTKSSLKPPSSNGYLGLACIYLCGAAENTAQLQGAFGNSGGTGTYKDAYIYEPVDKDGNLCWDNNCVKYNLYWISETDNTTFLGIPGLKQVKSKHR